MPTGIHIPGEPVATVSKLHQMYRGANAFQINCSGVAWGILLVIVDEGAALLLLPLEQPITDFKNEVRKLRVAPETSPGAEGLHQPRYLAKITKITKTMAIVAKRPVKFLRINVSESGFCRGRQRQ